MRFAHPILNALSQAGFAAALAHAECASPAFTTSDPNGGWSNGGYYVHNNMWNRDATLGPETLSACSYKEWYVVSNQVDEAGAVKTYPNVHKDFANVPFGSFPYLTSTFAAVSPHLGIYNVAYDIWLNGVATTGSKEVMIWTENYKQVPAGSKADTVTLGDHPFTVWKTNSNAYFAFVPASPMTSGTLDLKGLIGWLIGKGWLPANPTLGQICYGVEIVSTNGTDAKFTFSDFSISTAPPDALVEKANSGTIPGEVPSHPAYSIDGRRRKSPRQPHFQKRP